MKKAMFTWYIFLCINAFVGFWLYYFGMFQWAISVDISHITIFITSLYVVTFFSLGWTVYHASPWDPQVEAVFDPYDHISAQFIGLGLFGTVVGLIYLIGFDSDLKNLNFEDKAQIIKLMAKILPSLGIALVTTAAGLIASMLMSNQVYYLVRNLKYET